jgi:hypothetical protein
MKALFTHTELTRLGFKPVKGVYEHGQKDIAWFPCCNALFVRGRMKHGLTKENFLQIIKK